MSTQEQTSTQPTPSAKPAATPTYVDFFYYKVDAAFRRLPLEDRKRAVDEFRTAVTAAQKRADVRTYSTLGYTSECDFLLWIITKNPDEIQTLASDVTRTGLGHYLTLRYAFLAVTKPTPYTGNHPQSFELGPSFCKYLFVYPFVKTNEWYLLPFEKRQEMMVQHRKVGAEFPKIRVNTTYSFGLGDQDFMLAFEGDDLKEFSDLVQRLRETEARKYTVRDTPFLVGVMITLDDLLNQLALV